MKNMNVFIGCTLFLTMWSMCMKKEHVAPENKPGMSENGEAYERERAEMVATQIRARGIHDERLLNALLTVPRHLFVPQEEWHLAYGDFPLPIGYDQTISQPYIVAYMTDMLGLKPEERVLEIGTGSGYQAAVLAKVVKEVYSIEIVQPLCEQANRRLQQLGYDNVQVRCGDGYAGWPEAAPFDAIMITAAPETIPPILVEQLAAGGRLILPIGREYQELILLKKEERGKISRQTLIPVRFVPMTGQIER
jgi:protein-L-isoaspartate(D-aspartate) O-methyltransferase